MLIQHVPLFLSSDFSFSFAKKEQPLCGLMESMSARMKSGLYKPTIRIFEENLFACKG